MTHFNGSIRFIDQFLNNFQPMFTNTQMATLRTTVYGMFYDYKRLNFSAISRKTNTSYEKLQYFFSDSDWSIDTLNDVRLNILQNQPTTRATPNGVFAIDDTGCPKPYAKKTEGAQYQHCGSLDHNENCNVAVASCFVSNSKHFPVNFKSYIPEDQCKPNQFKSKLDLAKDLIDHAIDKNIPFKDVVFDSWYTSSDLIEFIASKGLTLVADTKLNRSILWTDPVTKQRIYKRADEIAPSIMKHFVHRLKHVEVPQENGKIKHPLTFTMQSKLKDCSTPLQIFFIFDKWSDSDDKDMHVLITNNLTMSVETAIFTYLMRWGIEESFRELKDNFCFDQYQVRRAMQRGCRLSYHHRFPLPLVKEPKCRTNAKNKISKI